MGCYSGKCARRHWSHGLWIHGLMIAGKRATCRAAGMGWEPTLRANAKTFGPRVPCVGFFDDCVIFLDSNAGFTHAGAPSSHLAG